MGTPRRHVPSKDYHGPNTGNDHIIIRPVRHLVRSVDKPLDITDNGNVIREKQEIIDFSHLLVSWHITLEAIARAQPIFRTRPQGPCRPEASRGGEKCPAYTLNLIDAAAYKQAKLRRQQLIYADAPPIHPPFAIRAQKRTCAYPQPIISLDQARRVIVNLGNYERLTPEILIQIVGCLPPKAEPEIAACVPPQDHTGTIWGLLEHRIVHQCPVQELGRFVIGKDIAIEVVGEVEFPDKEIEAVVDKLQPQPGLSDCQL